jgi:hypothetical protein
MRWLHPVRFYPAAGAQPGIFYPPHVGTDDLRGGDSTASKFVSCLDLAGYAFLKPNAIGIGTCLALRDC